MSKLKVLTRLHYVIPTAICLLYIVYINNHQIPTTMSAKLTELSMLMLSELIDCHSI